MNLGVVVLIDVVEDDVEVPIDLIDQVQRISHEDLNAVTHTRTFEIFVGFGGIFRISVRVIHRTARLYCPGPPDRRVADRGAHFKNPTGFVQQSELIEELSYGRTDDGYSMLPSLRFHFGQYGVTRTQKLVHVAFYSFICDSSHCYDPQMKFRAVLFDAAETLFTTRGSVGEIYAAVAHRYGSTATPENIQAAFVRNFRGAGPVQVENEKAWWKNIVHRVFTEAGMVENFDQFFDQVYDTFRNSQGWVLFPETYEVLKELKTGGCKLGVVSNFDTRIYTVMQSLGILEFFDAVTTSSETGFCKPDREIFEAAVRALNVMPSETVLVGDSLRDDVEAGIRAGLQALLIDRNGRYSSASVDRISSLRELIPLCGPQQ
jgi:putative hydrolase of the HAD superfamily